MERVEIAVRSRLAYAHAHEHGPFGYAENPAALFATRPVDRAKFLARLRDDVASSHEPFAKHFRSKYGNVHAHPPVWVTAEVLTFGGLVTLFRGSDARIKKQVAKPFAVADKVFESWLLTLNAVRNICAHHARLWNRELGIKPIVPRHDTDWYAPVLVENERIFGILTILTYCLATIAPGDDWPRRVDGLLRRFPSIPHRQMGIPNDWCRCPIWARSLA